MGVDEYQNRSKYGGLPKGACKMTFEEARARLFQDSYPLSAHDSILVESILRDLLTYWEEVYHQRGLSNPKALGLIAAVAYFEAMGNMKAEQEHLDAFCTPIIEGS